MDPYTPSRPQRQQSRLLSSAEVDIRRRLGIPETAAQVIFLGQTSHLDWDWRTTMRGYLHDGFGIHQPVTKTLQQAFQLMAGSPDERPYFYAIAELGYLKAFLEENPSALDGFATSIGSRLRLVGGGITSPDNLLPHGEAFVRNYLVGAVWAEATLGLSITVCWIPDDFGHDGQLPVLVQALGLTAAGFSRVAGLDPKGDPRVQGSPADDVLRHQQADFFWAAADGSQCLAHYMQAGYCQGNGIAGDCAQACDLDTLKTNVETNIAEYLAANGAYAPTDYVFVPVGCDFSAPVTATVTDDEKTYDLRDFADFWNKYRFPATGAFALAAPFDLYAAAVGAALADAGTKARSFHPTPYWTGFYASRPAIKILHQRATRALLAAEVLGLLADAGAAAAPQPRTARTAARQRQQTAAWFDLAPSTHHDYVTGTAAGAGAEVGNDFPVYPSEQVPLLANAECLGAGLRDAALQEVAARVSLAGLASGTMPVLVANPLGWQRSQEVVALSPLPPGGIVAAADGTPVQQNAEELLFVAGAPAYGYATAGLTMGSPPSAPTAGGVSITKQSDTSFAISGSGFTAVVGIASIDDAQNDWLIESLDLASGASVFPASVEANLIQFWHDVGGTLYRFGNEQYNGDDPLGSFTLDATSPRRQPGPAIVLESGPLRATLQTTTLVTLGGSTVAFIVEYSAVWNEPWLRIRVTGRAPRNYAVSLAFPIDPATDGVAYGTTYHWDDAPPQAGWTDPPSGRFNPPVFQVCHDFVLPSTGGVPAYAIYHDSLLCWSDLPGDGVRQLLTVPWRNAQGLENGTCADPDVHTHQLAVRIPTGLGGAATGQPLQEARQLQQPLLATLVSSGADGSLGTTVSVASIAGVSDGASVLLTAAKVGSRFPDEVVLRFYKPTNDVQPQVKVAFDLGVLGGGSTSQLVVTGLDGLERELPPAAQDALGIQIAPGGFTFTAPFALTTLGVSIAGVGPATARSTRRP